METARETWYERKHKNNSKNINKLIDILSECKSQRNMNINQRSEKKEKCTYKIHAHENRGYDFISKSNVISVALSTELKQMMKI